MKSSDAVLARRYSQAICLEAESSGNLGEINRELEEAHRLLREQMPLFLHPLIPVPVKKGKIQDFLGSRASPLIIRALELLIEKKRFYLLPAILVRLQEILDEKMGLRKAYVRTALPLSLEQERNLRASLKTATGKDIILQIKEDPSLIGGVVVRMGDWVLDASFFNALNRMRDAISGVAK